MKELKELGMPNLNEVKTFFKSVFTIEPWNDDWSNENQLTEYITDLIGNKTSLTFGLFEDDKMLGLAMGRIKHWYSGTEYNIDEFCISTAKQGEGLGTYFINAIGEAVKSKGVKSLFLQTERSVPAYKFYKKNNFFELVDHVSFVKDV